MRKLNIKPTVLLNALVISFIALVFLFIIFYFPGIPVYIILLMFVVIFGIGILLINQSIKRLVIDRIKPLYKLIKKTSISDSELKKELKNSDPILAFTKDFDEWANERRFEVKQLTEMEKLILPISIIL